MLLVSSYGVSMYSDSGILAFVIYISELFLVRRSELAQFAYQTVIYIGMMKIFIVVTTLLNLIFVAYSSLINRRLLYQNDLLLNKASRKASRSSKKILHIDRYPYKW